jgi:hypothetical protein
MKVVAVFSLGILIGASVSSRSQLPPPAEWSRADAETVRLAPSRFPDLPAAIRRDLERRQCTVPQPYSAAAGQPKNVIHGRFTSSTAIDWAVLCSRQRRSSILIFRGGDTVRIDGLASEADAEKLQVTGPGKIGYSRGIVVASPANIRAHNRTATESLPPLDHDGVDDAFLGKASVIWFWSGDRWRQLMGSDDPMRNERSPR